MDYRSLGELSDATTICFRGISAVRDLGLTLCTVVERDLSSMTDPQPTDSLALKLADLGARLDQRLAAMLIPYNLTPAEFRILTVLVERGSTNAAEISDLTPIDPSFISRMVQRLAEKRLLSRRRSRTDRRTVSLRATKSGQALLTQLQEPIQQLEQEFIQGLTQSDLRRVEVSIDAMTSNLGERDEAS